MFGAKPKRAGVLDKRLGFLFQPEVLLLCTPGKCVRCKRKHHHRFRSNRV